MSDEAQQEPQAQEQTKPSEALVTDPETLMLDRLNRAGKYADRMFRNLKENDQVGFRKNFQEFFAGPIVKRV